MSPATAWVSAWPMVCHGVVGEAAWARVRESSPVAASM